MSALPSMRCVCGHWDTEHAAFTRNVRPGKTRTFCDRCECRSWLTPYVEPSPEERLREALERVARSSREVNGACVWCGNASLATYHRDDCPKEIARVALTESRE